MSAKSGPFDLGQSLNEALSLHRQGQLREAEKIYTRVLKAAPDNFDALNLLGSIKAQLGRMGEAHRLFGEDGVREQLAALHLAFQLVKVV